MALPPEERAKIEAIPLCGPRMADYLERVGICAFDELAEANAGALRLAVNAALGRPHINAMGERAFQNAIDAACAARGRKG